MLVDCASMEFSTSSLTAAYTDVITWLLDINLIVVFDNLCISFIFSYIP